MIKYVLTALALGAVAGYLNNNLFNAIPNTLVSDQLFSLSLVVLLFVFGFSFGIDKDAVQKMKKTGPKILAFPFFVVLGSLVGGLVSGLILSISMAGAMAVSAGCGWYTLSGPLIGQLFGAELGTLGFVTNFFRELLTITMIPLIIKLDKYAPVASGGATTMDTTLPVIMRYCGDDVLITAFSNGLILTLIVPFTIIAISSLMI
jgi:uncharacterized membrane protein YbjE (DUF340 family)